MSIAGPRGGAQADPSVLQLSEVLNLAEGRANRTPAPYTDETFDQPLFTGRVRGYVVAATERSGSTLLCDLLYRSGKMGVPAEYFSSVPVSLPLALRFGTMLSNGAIAMRPYVQTLLRRRTTPNGVFGLNLHHWQALPLLRRPSTQRLLRNSRYVWLRRRDLLGQAISLAIARTTDEWYRTPGGPAPPEPPPDLAVLRRELAYLTYSNFEWERIFAANGIKPLELFYEDLVADANAVCQQVCRHIKLRRVPTFDLSQAGYARQSGPANARWRAAYEESLRIGSTES